MRRPQLYPDCPRMTNVSYMEDALDGFVALLGLGGLVVREGQHAQRVAEDKTAVKVDSNLSQHGARK